MSKIMELADAYAAVSTGAVPDEDRYKIGLRIQEARAALAAAVQEVERDALRLDWVENSHTLHKAVEFLYVVDGYEVQHTYDGNVSGEPVHGETLREAIDAAIAAREGGAT